MKKILVELNSIKLELPNCGFRLASGQTLKEISVAYESYGDLAEDKKNVIYICHALTSDAHAAGYHSEKDKNPGWWDAMIGPGKSIDTNKYHVICSNILGGCQGTTGPSSINPDNGLPYGSEFPLLTIKDVVQVQKLLLDQLQIPELYCVIGGSLGGMQVLEWSVCYPDFVRRSICIASAASLTSQALAFDIISRKSIESDPNWHEGQYSQHNILPKKGLSQARQIGHVTYLSSVAMKRKFGREHISDKSAILPSKFSTDFQVESYLTYQGNKFCKRFDANSYLYISRMMDVFDLADEHGSLSKAFEGVKSHFLIVSISSDWLFPESQSLEIVSTLINNRKSVSYFHLDSPYGHDAFLIEFEILGHGIEAFLNGKPPKSSPPIEDSKDFDQLSELIEDRAFILDVGSGPGDQMTALKRIKNVEGICLDLDFQKVVECMRKGLAAIQLDADTGLRIIADNAFDGVLLNQTIQQLRSALQTLKQIVRISNYGVIGFSNFAYFNYRFALSLRGQLPVSGKLPFEWYNTPNIHLITVKDFRNLCDRNNILIEEIQCLSDDFWGKMLLFFGLTNLGSERNLVKISRQRKV